MIGTKILKLFKKLICDKSLKIRQKTIEALAKIIKIYKEKSKKLKETEKKEDENLIKIDGGTVKNFVELLETLILDEQECVREKIIENIGEIISPLEKEELSQKIFDFYLNSLNEHYNPTISKEKDTQDQKKKKVDKTKNQAKVKNDKKNETNEDISYFYAFNFPAILFCYGKEVWTDLKKAFGFLCKDKNFKVRRSMIASFHEISKILGEKITEQELLPIYDEFLNSKNNLEKNFAIKCLPKNLFLFPLHC